MLTPGSRSPFVSDGGFYPVALERGEVNCEASFWPGVELGLWTRDPRVHALVSFSPRCPGIFEMTFIPRADQACSDRRHQWALYEQSESEILHGKS